MNEIVETVKKRFSINGIRTSVDVTPDMEYIAKSVYGEILVYDANPEVFFETPLNVDGVRKIYEITTEQSKYIFEAFDKVSWDKSLRKLMW